ncbi:MAG: hypothetical protein A2583_12910 [Bdellovibrionales bacterium RIFOXYD1_FULL_53_11]|nr:MAG: hypothetical protein A2583_12910 [Bdellovibrionales bacterium RIFOXYD1_FULL_53_11]
MEKSILGYKCTKCAQVHYPNRTLCRKCGHNEFTTLPLPKSGKLLTFTHLYTLPADFEVTSIGLGIVELDGGTRITGQLEIEKPEIGMKVRGDVKMVRNDGYNNYYGMVFYRA